MFNSDFDLSGKSALITGASRGIGEASARRLAAAGAYVVLAARSAERCEAIAAEIREAGGKAVAIACDVSSFEDVQAAVELTKAETGQIDILLNNAGLIEPVMRIGEGDVAGWDKVIDVNVKGVYYGLHLAAPAMAANGGGVIINISSGAAVSALEGWSHYCSSKAAVKMLTAATHREFADKGLFVVGLSPGTVATGMQTAIKTSGVNPVSQLDWSAHIPPEWVGEAIAWLATGHGREYAGNDVSLRADVVRQSIGLPTSAEAGR